MLTFTNAEVEVLATARRLLRDIERRCEHEYAEYSAVERQDYTKPDPMDFGRLAEAANHAEESIFNVFNVAKNYARVDISEEQMSL